MDVFHCTAPALTIDGVHETTLIDCVSCPYKPREAMPDARKLILHNHDCPGDVLAMTAAIHSLHKRHPGRFLTAYDGTAPELFEHNPDISPLAKAREEKWEEMHCHYPLIDQSNQLGVHFMEAYCRFFEDNLQVPVPLGTNRPVVYLSEQEKGWQNQVIDAFGYRGRFWLVNAGYKADATIKGWPWYQEAVDRLKGKVVFVQVGAIDQKGEHVHPPLKGALNLVGRTDLRQLVRLVYHASGVLCGTTLLMHLAAAFDKPSVVVVGSREPRAWNSYPRQTLLSNVGAVDCPAAKDGACWRQRVVQLPDGATQNNSLCDQPVFHTERPAARCMALISPQAAADAVEAYYDGGVLSR